MQGTWSTLPIGGKPAEVYDPPGSGRPRFGVLFLHGIGQESLRDRPAFTRWLDEFRLACVCPNGHFSWWSDRVWPEFDPQLTAEKYLLQAVLPFFNERWGLQPRALGLLGISMGGQGALRLAFKYPRVFPVVAGISSAIDHYEFHGYGHSLDVMYDSKEQCRQDTVPLHVHPNDYPPQIFFCIDPDDTDWVRGNDRLHEKLSALGVTHEIDFTSRAGGHSWDYFNHAAERAIRFLNERLERESRRLL